jgi:orotate phosphoribosyltransferase
MTSQQASSLLRYGLYQFGENVFKSGRVTPYTVRLPQSPQKKLFQSLAESAWNLRQLATFQRIDCIGIANSGIPLAEAIHEYGFTLGRSARCQIVHPRLSEQNVVSAERGVTSILIDNAVTTGDTIAKVLTLARQFGHEPKTILRIFDREDVGEDGLSTVERIKSRLDVDVVSIFRLRDMIPCLDETERRAVLAYQSVYGTSSFKEWIGGQHAL